MTLYTTCFQPFLAMLKQCLPGVCIGRSSDPVSVVAYADDVTVFLTSVADFSKVQEAIQQFERASGARLNPRKFRALPIGRWSASDILGISCRRYARILGFSFWGTLRQTVSVHPPCRTDKITSQDSYPRDLCLAHRIRLVHVYLFARLL
jgi:hypothetical protein